MSFSLHPQLVHFPIALLLVGSVLALLNQRWPREHWQTASTVMLTIGWWSGLLASASGFLAIALQFERAQRDAAWINAHAATSLLIIGVYWKLRPRANTQPPWHLHVVGMILIIVTGWLGGHLVRALDWR